MMKASQIIRECKLRQIYGDFFSIPNYPADMEVKGCCSIGVLLVSLKIIEMKEYYLTERIMDVIRDKFGIPFSVQKDMITRNDTLKHTFIQIAEWLESRGY